MRKLLALATRNKVARFHLDFQIAGSKSGRPLSSFSFWLQCAGVKNSLRFKSVCLCLRIFPFGGWFFFVSPLLPTCTSYASLHEERLDGI